MTGEGYCSVERCPRTLGETKVGGRDVPSSPYLLVVGFFIWEAPLSARVNRIAWSTFSSSSVSGFARLGSLSRTPQASGYREVVCLLPGRAYFAGIPPTSRVL